MDEQELQRAMESFIASLAQPSIPHWDALPDLDLYMDQVIAFMEKYLSLFGDSRDKLIACRMSVDEIAKSIGVESLTYLSVDGVKRIAKDAKCGFCVGCFTGEYPIAVPDVEE